MPLALLQFRAIIGYDITIKAKRALPVMGMKNGNIRIPMIDQSADREEKYVSPPFIQELAARSKWLAL